MQRAIRNESIEQAAPFQKIDEERQLPERRQRRLGIPFDMHRPGETAEAHALQRAFVFNRRLLTPKVNGGTRKIGHYANDNARFSSNPNQPTAVSRINVIGREDTGDAATQDPGLCTAYEQGPVSADRGDEWIALSIEPRRLSPGAVRLQPLERQGMWLAAKILP